MRGGDVVARYGGEEFCLILFDCDTKAAYQIIEKISRSIEAVVFENPKGSFHVTISVGICSSKEKAARKAEDLIRLADESLYQAKAAGRNRIVIYPAMANTESPAP